jgi:hypothetical protein
MVTENPEVMSIRKQIPVVVLVLTVALLSAGCVSSLPGGDSGGSALEDSSVTIHNGEDLRQASVERMEGIDTYAFEMNMTMESSLGNVNMEMDGVTNITERKVQSETTVGGSMRTVDLTQYIIDNKQYLNARGNWETQDLPYEGDAWNQHKLANQQALLQNASVEIVDNRSFDGHDVYVVEMDMSDSAARELVLQQQHVLDRPNGYQMGSVSVENFESTMYIDADKHVVRHVESNLEYAVDGVSADMTLMMTLSEFNESVDIELPDDAPDSATFD